MHTKEIITSIDPMFLYLCPGKLEWEMEGGVKVWWILRERVENSPKLRHCF